MPLGPHLMRASNGSADADVKSILETLAADCGAILR